MATAHDVIPARSRTARQWTGGARVSWQIPARRLPLVFATPAVGLVLAMLLIPLGYTIFLSTYAHRSGRDFAVTHTQILVPASQKIYFSVTGNRE